MSTLFARGSLIAALLLLQPPESRAADLVVDGLDDVVAGDSICTLREAVNAANADADGSDCVASGSYGDDRITFAVAGRIDLAGDLEVFDSLTIQGAGAVTLDAGGSDRVLTAQGDDLVLRLEGLTLQNGEAPGNSPGGGCILLFGARATLEVLDTIIQDCFTTVDLAFQDSSGGAILIGRSAGVEPREPSGPTMTTRLALTRSEIRNARVFTENGAARGGAIFAGPDRVAVTMVDSRIVDSVADSNIDGVAEGGAMYLAAPTPLEIDRSELTGNQAAAFGNSAAGGAIFIADLREPGFITNTTIADNQALAVGASGTEARGGAIYGFIDDDVSLEIGNTTIFENRATPSMGASAFSGGIEFGAGSGPAWLGNTILAGNQAADQPSDCESNGVIRSRGFNVVETDCGLPVATGDRFGMDPLLEPLAINGGVLAGMRSHRPSAGSPALDGGSPEPVLSSPSACRSDDQRGLPRPVDAGGGAVCDIGAVERQDAPIPPARPVPGLGPAGMALLIVLLGVIALRVSTRG